MKIGLLGDIHGNHLALKAVLEAAQRYGVERLLVTGDLVGYYFWPKDVLDLLAPWDMTVVRGNHEDMLTKARTDGDFLCNINGRYGTGVRTAIEQLDSHQLDWLCGLPHPLTIVVDDCTILLCHGAPWDNNQYVYPDAEIDLFTKCAIQEYDLVIMGHTHYPMKIQIGRTFLVNPGSVGQPRDCQPGAHWALFDSGSSEVMLHCEYYDAELVIRESRRRHPDVAYLAEVLERT